MADDWHHFKNKKKVYHVLFAEFFFVSGDRWRFQERRIPSLLLSGLNERLLYSVQIFFFFC